MRTLGDRRGIAQALSGTAKGYQVQNKEAVALPLLKEALTIQHELGDRFNMIGSLIIIAIVAVRQQPARTAQLLAAQTQLSHAIGMSTILYDQQEIQAYLALAHANLDEATYASAWHAGQTMTWETAVQTALETLDRVLAATAPTASSTSAALQRNHNRLTDLTRRELEILRLVATGLADARIAEQLVISRRTVNTHLSSIYSKLGVNSRTAAMRFALDLHLL